MLGSKNAAPERVSEKERKGGREGERESVCVRYCPGVRSLEKISYRK